VTRRLRRFTEWTVYGFLAWFESFDSVWQTTLLCGAGLLAAVTATIIWPHDLLVALLIAMFTNVLSVYATFTQNGLAHENKLNSNKIDQSLGKHDQSLGALLQLARNQTHMQETLVAQTEAIAAALAEIHAHTKPTRRRTP
jgi:hypothetical protein